jgi:diguanylate cyclase (GGDEF)-like protein
MALVGAAMILFYPHAAGVSIGRYLLCFALPAAGGAALLAAIICRVTGAAVKVAHELAGLIDQCRITGRMSEVPERLTQRGDEAGMLSRAVGLMMKRVNSVLREKEYMAYHDSLTRLKNRYRLKEDVAALLARREPFAFALLDIDDFKRINDVHGHAQGDRLLVDMAALLSDVCVGSAEVYRWGGDEFVMLISGDGGACREALENVMDQVKKVLQPQHQRICVSMGVCLSSENGETYGDLLIAADRALDMAKKQGKGRYVLCGSKAAAPGGGTA